MNKFISFLDSFLSYDPTLVESIKLGYYMIEAWSDEDQALLDELEAFYPNDGSQMSEQEKAPEIAPIKEEGNIIALHGTNADFDEFRSEKIGSNFPNTKDGFFFSDDRDYVEYLANKMAKKNGGTPMVYQCELALGRTYSLRNYFDTFDEKESSHMYSITNGDVIDIFDSFRDDIIAKAKYNQCNSIHFRSHGENLYVIFNADQIKILNKIPIK